MVNQRDARLKDRVKGRLKSDAKLFDQVVGELVSRFLKGSDSYMRIVQDRQLLFATQRAARLRLRKTKAVRGLRQGGSR